MRRDQHIDAINLESKCTKSAFGFRNRLEVKAFGANNGIGYFSHLPLFWSFETAVEKLRTNDHVNCRYDSARERGAVFLLVRPPACTVAVHGSEKTRLCRSTQRETSLEEGDRKSYLNVLTLLKEVAYAETITSLPSGSTSE